MLTIRDLTADDLDQAFDVRLRSFGPLEPGGRAWWDRLQLAVIAQGRALGAFEDGRLVATAKARAFRQLWGGRGMAMAGIQGVVVAPHARGRGVGSRLLRALMARGVELGDLVSALYPATVVPYRRLGWELAGNRHRVSIDARLLRELPTGPSVRPAGPADAETVIALAQRLHTQSRSNGPRLWDVDEAREDLEDADTFAYLADDGVCIYGWDGEDLRVRALLAGDAATAQALWAVVGSGSSTAKTVHANLAPDDPVHHLLAETVAPQTQQQRWMLRLLDAPAAVAARGFPAGVLGSAGLVVDDPELASGGGSWRFEIAGGRAQLLPAPVGDGPRMGPGALACLYAGTPLHLLRAAGLVAGGSPAADKLLDAAFAGRPAYLLDYF